MASCPKQSVQTHHHSAFVDFLWCVPDQTFWLLRVSLAPTPYPGRDAGA